MPSRISYGTCVPRYFLFIISAWRISYGWLRFINKLTLTIAMLLTGLATIPDLLSTTRTNLGIGAMFCEGIALFCQGLSDYAGEAVTEHKRILREIEEEEKSLTVTASNISQTSVIQ